jgi:hypothetical protein
VQKNPFQNQASKSQKIILPGVNRRTLTLACGKKNSKHCGWYTSGKMERNREAVVAGSPQKHPSTTSLKHFNT